MRGLKSIVFYNTGRFPYAHIDVNGNTLLTGTNGAGKTTTNQSVLFFYGNNRKERLGITNTEGKLGWIKYMYPYTNSFVFYRYGSVNGDVLLMTYAYSTGVACRFIPLEAEPNLDALVLENGVPRSPQDVSNGFIQAGLKPSRIVSDFGLFRRIIYGDIDFRKEKDNADFRHFTMINAGRDFHHIPDMLSSIFVNAKINESGGGSIEQAITSGYGMQTSLSITQMREQIHKVTERYEAVQAYTKHDRLIQKMIYEANEYKRLTQEMRDILIQLYADGKWYEGEISKMSTEESKAQTEESDIRVTIRHAKEKADKYSIMDMSALAKEVDLIPTLDNERGQKRSEYDNSMGEAKNIAGAYDDMIKAEKNGLEDQIRANSSLFEKQKALLRSQREAELSAYESDVADIDGRFEEENRELKEAFVQSEMVKDTALKVKAKAQAFNPYLEDVNKLKIQISETKNGISNGKKEGISLDKQTTALVNRRGEIERTIEQTGKDAERRFEVEKKPYDEEIRILNAKLEASEESVLGLIRREIPEMEQVLASLLKDDILLSSDISPHVVEIQPSAYGLMFDIDSIEKSEFTKEAMIGKIQSIGKEISDIQKRITSETGERLALLEKEKGEVQKELYSIKLKKDGLDGALAQDASRLLSMEEEFLEAQEGAEERWRSDKSAADETYLQAQKHYDALKRKNDEAIEKTRDLKKDRRVQYESAIASNEQKIALLSEELKSSNFAASTRSAEVLKEIEKKRDEALKDGGYSAEKISLLREAMEKADGRYHAAVNNAGLVASWRGDLSEIEKITEYELRHAKCVESLALVRNKNEARRNEIIQEKGRYESDLSAIARKIENYQFFISDSVKATWESYEYSAMVKSLEGEIDTIVLPNYSNDSAAKLRSTLRIRKETQWKHGSVALSELQRFVGQIPGGEDFVLFAYDRSGSGGVDGAIRSIDSLKEYIESGMLDEVKSTIATDIKIMQGDYGAQYESFNSESKTIELLIGRIDKALKKAIEHIPVLNDIGIRVLRNEHKIFRDLEALSKVDLPYGDMKSLFGDSEKSKRSSSEIFEHFGTLLGHLSEEKRETLTIADTIEVQFAVTENGNRHDWSSAKKGVGSEGTSRIIKSLAYIALLRTVIDLTKEGGDEVPVHVMLDEIGTIDQSNMRQVIQFANDNGIYLLNAAPDVKIPDKYSQIYMYKLDGKGKSRVMKLAVRT